MKPQPKSYRLLFDSVHDAIVEIDVDGRIRDWSKGAETMLGWKRSEVIGRLFYSILVMPEKRNAARKGYLNAMRGKKKGMRRRRIMVFSKGGEIKFVDIITSTLVDKRNKPCGGLAIMKDVTCEVRLREELKKKLAQLEERNRQLEEFKDFAVQREKELMRLRKRVAELERKLRK